MKDDTPTDGTADSDFDVSRREVLGSIPLGLTFTTVFGQSTTVSAKSDSSPVSDRSGPLADHTVVDSLDPGVRMVVGQCLMLRERLTLRQDLFERFGPVTGELSLRDQLTEISEKHCDLYTRVKLQNERTDRCLAIDREKHDFDGAPVTVQTCADTSEQEWRLVGRDDGDLKLQNQSTGRCLAIDRAEDDHEGGRVTSETCAMTVEQQWELTLRPNGNAKLRNEGTGRCLNVHGGRHDHDGAPVTSFTCADTPDQEWELLNKAAVHRESKYGSAEPDDMDRFHASADDEDYFLRPVTDAEYPVDDVVSAFKAIEFGRSSGTNFFSKGVGWVDDGHFADHMQGVARLPGGGLVQSNTDEIFLTYFPEKSEYGHEPWRNRTDRVETMPVGGRPGWDGTRIPMHKNKLHIGGVHAYHDTIVVPWSRKDTYAVSIYDHAGWGKTESGERYWKGHEMTTLEISEYQEAAHYASILPLADGTWLLAVGKDPRRGRKDSGIHFYAIEDFPEESWRYSDGDPPPEADFRYLGLWDRGETRHDFQSVSLVAGSSGRVFLIGTGVQVVQSQPRAKLYEVTGFRRSDGDRPDAWLEKIAVREPDSERNDCNLNAGATFFPTANGGLAMYCTEKEIHDASITTREYRNEDA